MKKNPVTFILRLFIMLAALAFVAEGATPAQYRENIAHLKDDLSSLLAPDDGRTDAEREKFIDEISEELAELFPPKQKIEWPAGTVETDSRWLVERFAEFKKLPPEAPERRQILAEIYERLDAVERKLIELENAAVSGPSKDDEKQKLAEILRREEYARPEQQEESFIQRAYRRFMEWLRSLAPESKSVPSAEPPGFQALPFVLQILIYTLVAALIGYLIYKFAPFVAARLRTREARESRERIILGERIAAGETGENLFEQAERLAREGDLRGAIRKGYIALLCELADRKIIGLSKNKTNRDYLRDVRRRNELFQNMQGLTNNYERHWYGSQEADRSDWEEFKEGYRRAVKSG